MPECRCTPRACQCAYCLEKGAAYVAEPGSRVDVSIANSAAHAIVQHGKQMAEFHECTDCDQVVLVTAEMDGTLYGVLNSAVLHNKENIAAPEKHDFSNQSVEQKRARWRKNWCTPVLITSDEISR